MPSWPNKDPDELLDYYINWTDRLRPGETIATSTWAINSGSITPAAPPQSAIDAGWAPVEAGYTSQWYSGGELGEVCDITNHIVTSQGRSFDKSGKLRIRKH